MAVAVAVAVAMAVAVVVPVPVPVPVPVAGAVATAVYTLNSNRYLNLKGCIHMTGSSSLEFSVGLRSCNISQCVADMYLDMVGESFACANCSEVCKKYRKCERL